MRFESVWRECPKPVRIFILQALVNWCEFSPDGMRVVSARLDVGHAMFDVQAVQAALAFSALPRLQLVH
jgi:hypothetical protein